MDLKTFKKAEELFQELDHLKWAETDLLVESNKQKPLTIIMMGFESQTADRFSNNLKKKMLKVMAAVIREEIIEIEKTIKLL